MIEEKSLRENSKNRKFKKFENLDVGKMMKKGFSSLGYASVRKDKGKLKSRGKGKAVNTARIEKIEKSEISKNQKKVLSARVSKLGDLKVEDIEDGKLKVLTGFTSKPNSSI